MTIETLTREVTDLRRRIELAETKLSQQAGQFEFISGQLRDVQLYMHAKFGDIDARFDKLESKMDRKFAEVDQRFAGVEAKIDALPRIIAEMIAKPKK